MVSGSCRWRIWSVARRSSSSRSTRSIRGGNSGSGRSRFAGPGSRWACIEPAALSTAIETILGHEFSRPELLREAMTHRSAIHGRTRGKGRDSNERMEFIGDRVLGLLIAEWLIDRFPREQEGELGRRLAHLVSQPVLARVAEVIGLGEALSVSPGEARAGVRRRAT